MSDEKWKVQASLIPLEKGDEKRLMLFMSTDDVDEDGEKILQDGIDFQYFIKNGRINDNHLKGTADVIGYPIADTLAYKEYKNLSGEVKKGWAVEGKLINTTKANDIYNVAVEFEKAGRPLGCSIEGNYGARDTLNPKIVKKAIVRNVAITPNPVNVNTEVRVLSKSRSNEDFWTNEELVKAMTLGETSGVDSVGADSMVKESIDRSIKKTTYGSDEDKKKKKKRKKKGRLSVQDAIKRVMDMGVEKSIAEKIVSMAKIIEQSEAQDE